MEAKITVRGVLLIKCILYRHNKYAVMYLYKIPSLVIIKTLGMLIHVLKGKCSFTTLIV